MPDDLKPIIEALIFASPDPLTPKMLFKLLENEPREDVEAALEALKRDYDRRGGLQMPRGVIQQALGTSHVPQPESRTSEGDRALRLIPRGELGERSEEPVRIAGVLA